IEQENKCKKDSECENQNELDNKLTVKKTVLSENEGKENKIGFMYVTNYNDGTVSVIDTATNTVVDTITVGSGQYWIAFDSQNNRMYVTNYNDGTVSVIDTAIAFALISTQ
ncbi:MAG: hypothetical protein DA328_08480, partial [Nitrososphaeraceae archaeon]|nr:hypothetical protein [Nitrososphaeraceae archaeon]